MNTAPAFHSYLPDYTPALPVLQFYPQDLPPPLPAMPGLTHTHCHRYLDSDLLFLYLLVSTYNLPYIQSYRHSAYLPSIFLPAHRAG